MLQKGTGNSHKIQMKNNQNNQNLVKAVKHHKGLVEVQYWFGRGFFSVKFQVMQNLGQLHRRSQCSRSWGTHSRGENHHIRIISKRFAVVKSICVSTNLAVSISEPFCLVITQILTNLLPDPWLLEKLAWTILHFFIIVGSGIWIKKEIFRYGNMNKKILHHYYKIFVENLKLLCNILVQHITSDNQFVCN